MNFFFNFFSKMTFARKVIEFNNNLDFKEALPLGVSIMNPFRENQVVNELSAEFYTKFFSDDKVRKLILGINPGRFGAGSTGIPFTDTKRLNENCGISFTEFRTHEPSSAFIYEMIEALGGVNEFYGKYFLSAICPLGFTKKGKNEKPVNFNYYDTRELERIAYPFILDTLKKQIGFGVDTSVCYCLGTGKNDIFLRKFNKEHHLFDEIVSLEHPRYIMQYKARSKERYIGKYEKILR
jgi:hypothetical protein